MLGIPEGFAVYSGPMDYKQYSDQREVVKESAFCKSEFQFILC